MNTKLPDTYYQADNELLSARVHKLEEENRELRRTIERCVTSISRLKSDLQEAEEHSRHWLNKYIELKKNASHNR
jgi:predicted RNase H-like nuclease (RuvC/YqgF family)